MNDRDEAIDVLKQARDTLARQLMDRVLESQAEILDEANGFSYGGQIESIFEHFGARLANVNSMLSQLQMLDDEEILQPRKSPSLDESSPADGYEATATVADTLTPPEIAAADELLSVADHHFIQQDQDAATWESFVEHVRQQHHEAAVMALAELFELNPTRAERCVIKFSETCDADPSIFNRANQMRPQLLASSMDETLTMLWRLFELQGSEAVGVYHALRVNIERPAEPESSE